MEKNRKIYIVVSQTGSLPSRFLKQFTRAKYNHVSIGLRRNLQPMYSFGRRYKYYPFWGGFVAESPRFGTMSRFPDSQITILALDVTEAQYEGVLMMLDEMFRHRNHYHYDYLGVGLAYFKLRRQTRRWLYCSEFVKRVLLQNGIEAAEVLPAVTQPIHFLDLPGAETIFSGKLKDYHF